MKGKREVSWSGINVIFAGVQELERAREKVTVLLNDVWHSAVVKYGCVNSRNLWIKFKFSMVKVNVMVGNGPYEGNGEESERFWNDLTCRCSGVGKSY